MKINKDVVDLHLISNVVDLYLNQMKINKEMMLLTKLTKPKP